MGLLKKLHCPYLYGMQMFEVINRDSGSSARAGVLRTAHGAVQTPVFMPIATRGAVKGITPAQLAEAGATMVLPRWAAWCC